MVRRKDGAGLELDRIDRKLLGLLKEDATFTYAALGEAVHLSAPAVHERVRKLRRAGVIRRTTIDIDATAIGRPLLAFVHVQTRGWGNGEAMLAFGEDRRIEEMHSVTGSACLVLKVRCRDTAELEDVLEGLYALPNVRATQSFVAMRSPVERGTSP